jgi:signal transduction histidine kinase
MTGWIKKQVDLSPFSAPLASQRSTRQAVIFGQATDIAIAVGLTAVGFAALHFSNTPVGGRPPDALAYVLAAVISLPLAVRRRSPLGVLAVVMAGSLLYGARGYPEVNGDFFGPVIAYYTVVSQMPRRTAIVAGAVLWAAVALSLLISPLTRDNEAAVLTSGVIIVGIGLFGDSVRQRRVYASQLETRTQELTDARLELAEQAVVQERLRISRDLHDVVAHSISSIVVQASVARDAIGTNQAAAVAAIEHVQSISRGALAEIRQLLGILRRADESSPQPAPAPGLRDLDTLVSDAKNGGISVQASVEGEPSVLPATVDLTAYRIIQESLTNVVKHANGSRVQVMLSYGRDALCIEVVNSAPGSSAKRPAFASEGSGLGLAGMRERVSLLRGSLESGPLPDGGFRVSAVLPVRVQT